MQRPDDTEPKDFDSSQMTTVKQAGAINEAYRNLLKPRPIESFGPEAPLWGTGYFSRE